MASIPATIGMETPFSIVHEIPGRVRFDLSSICLLDDDELNKHFKDLSGISHMEFNKTTGRLLVKYDGDILVRVRIIKLLRALPRKSLTFSRTWGGKPVEEEPTESESKGILPSAVMFAGVFVFPPVFKIPFIILLGLPFFRKGASGLLKGKLNADVLDGSAIGVSIAGGDYGAAAIIAFLLRTGEYLEDWTAEKSRGTLSSMLRNDDDVVWLEVDGTEVQVKVRDIKKDDIVVVRTGGRIPVDGIVMSGEGTVSQAYMTGESLPVAKREGAFVYSGTVVEEGSIRIRAERVGQETTISSIIKYVDDSPSRKAKIQGYSEQLADSVVPFSFAAATLVYIFTGNLHRAGLLLLVDYSCAIKLATPAAIMASVTHSAKRGVLVKGGRYLEELDKTDTVIFDKTGTLTMGEPTVIEVVSYSPNYSGDDILAITASIEEHYTHPIAAAVVNEAKQKGLEHMEHGKLDYVVGRGVASVLVEKRVLVGSRHFLEDDEGISVAKSEKDVKTMIEHGESVLYVAIDRKLAGVIGFIDPVRKESEGVVERMKNVGIKEVMMLTGDSRINARAVSEEVGITKYFPELLPHDKAEITKELQQNGRKVLMIGDGINDSPALALADVGVSFKGGSDIAQETAPVVLMDENLNLITDAIDISKKTMRTIHQNFKAIIGVNSLAALIAVIGMGSPLSIALIHNGTTVAVTMNALRPIFEKLPSPPSDKKSQPPRSTSSAPPLRT